MNKSLKAVLLSALVFPGLGHFSLKKPVQGFLFSGITLICIYFLLSDIYHIAQQVSLQIQQGTLPINADSINESVTQQIGDNDNGSISTSSLLLLICWVVAMIDSFRIGRLQDKQDSLSNN